MTTCIVLFQVREYTFHPAHIKNCFIQQALPTRTATVFKQSVEGIDQMYKQIRSGFTSYLFSLNEIPSEESLLGICEERVATKRAKVIKV